jgi:hypothetical protein
MGEQEADRGEPLLLTSEDRANGFSIAVDDRYNTTLLKWGKQIAWFSVAISSRKVLRAFLELIEECERGAKGDIQFRRPPPNGIQNEYR